MVFTIESIFCFGNKYNYSILVISIKLKFFVKVMFLFFENLSKFETDKKDYMVVCLSND